MKTMKVESLAHGYVVKTRIDDPNTYDVHIKHSYGKWKVIPPHSWYDPKFLLPEQARALGRALVLAADWAMERNQKEKEGQ